ncbi:FAS1 domain-containing protein [Fomitiporia mediterranea MF3/22]|uniref:FAS1 domain-containing protein n=1 Tax=Fomitiporia mediterranea (strain MF3/22) TaxID=694068 RepID=UPI0004407A65|nr:FAS1 domain-containing protein [Fomitiporia mediterranea MF3/22]EJD02076.1 FAS1 domain-containing protein [Fomitiporia mediterranea MF3/22]
MVRLLAATVASIVAVSALNIRPGLHVQHPGDSYFTDFLPQPGNNHDNDLNIEPPHPPPHPHPTADRSIFTTLNENPEFSRLVKVVNISDEIVSLLNDTSTNVTFFALPNHAFPKRPHGPPHKPDAETFGLDLSLVDLVHYLDTFEEGPSQVKAEPSEKLKKIVTAILSYHIIPDGLELASLTKNTTYPTKLSHVFGALNDEPLRLRVGAGFPFVRVNFYSGIIRPDIAATNGFIHVVNHPLLPPPSIFQALFIAQREFSSFTSAIQRTGLTNALDYTFVPDDDNELRSIEGSPVVTTFAPSNKAFGSLPRKLQFFLFSRFGQRLLSKLLQYHIIPEVALYTDWVHVNLDSIADVTSEQHYEHPPHLPHLPHPKPEVVANYTLPTALENHSVNVLVVEIPIKLPIPGHGRKEISRIKKVVVNGQVVKGYDGPALNGAIHVVDRLVSPRHRRGRPHQTLEAMLLNEDYADEYDDDWEDWEEWLPAWAECDDDEWKGMEEEWKDWEEWRVSVHPS